MKYIIRDREAGNVITWFATREEAEEELAKYEAEDKRDGSFTEDFYEIVEEKTEMSEKTNGKVYKNFDTNEIWTETEIRESYEQLKWEPELEQFESFDDYLDYLLELGRQKVGGIVEI